MQQQTGQGMTATDGHQRRSVLLVSSVHPMQDQPGPTDRATRYSVATWARMQPADRRAALNAYWRALPEVTRLQLARKYSQG